MEDSLLTKSPKSYYLEEFLDIDIGDALFKELNKLVGWKTNEYNGRALNRQTIVFANEEIIDDPDKYPIPPIWGTDVVIMKWPPLLEYIKAQVEEQTGVKYTIALGNRYIKAKDAIHFHSDNEEFGNTQSIASISLGVPRTFSFKSKDVVMDQKPESKTLVLAHGSLLFMGENCQENYTHGMKKEAIVAHSLYGKTRINVTFRVWRLLVENPKEESK